MSKPPPKQPTQEEMVAAALNEQGFLFSQLVRDKVRCGVSGKGRADAAWSWVHSEYPVTASDGSQTRIDLVLRHVTCKNIYLCIECKRANPLYKQWVFFDREYGPGKTNQTELYFEHFSTHRRPIAAAERAAHGITRHPNQTLCNVFKSYLEVAINRQNKAGYTETIEDAFLQVVRGQTGLMVKLMSFESVYKADVIPVVVTTAQLFDVKFDVERVALNSGTIAATDLKLEPIESCAVNYHPNDSLTVRSYVAPGRPDCVEDDVMLFQTRTVFVVQAEAIIRFLNTLDVNMVGPR